MLNDNVLDIALVGYDGNTANISGNISSYIELTKQLKTTKKEKAIHLGPSNIIIGYKACICHLLAIPIYHLTTLEEIGILYLAINPESIITNLTAKADGIITEYLLVTKDNQLLSGDETMFRALSSTRNANKEFSITYQGVHFNCKADYIKSADAYLYTLTNTSEYTQGINQIAIRQVGFFILAFCIMALVLLLIFHPILTSIKSITCLMQKIRSGKRRALAERITIDKNMVYCKEIHSIATEFNGVLDEINTLNHTIFNTYTKMHELEIINRNTSIAYLRSQINPHFLYNTLTMICGMSSIGETDGVIEVTGALSQIFRYSIKGQAMVSVEEELEITKSYVMIQTIRFDNRFTVEYKFTEEALKAQIPKMVIQPLVENAVIHGLEKSLKKGNLQIGGLRNPKDNTLILWIYDTGIGMTTEKLEKLRNSVMDTNNITAENVNSTLLGSHGSIGLKNVNARIYLYYGNPYHLNIDSEENVGTNIQICIPYTLATDASI